MILFSIFALVTNIPQVLHSMVFHRLNDEARLDILRTAIQQRNWPAEITDRFSQFISAYRACAGSRHVLMHSLHSETEGGPAFKMTKKGSMQIGEPSLAEIRQAADDMEAWNKFGVGLIGRTMLNHQPDGSFSDKWPLPDIPAQPSNLSHKYRGA
jgi:hypothetical protein